MAVPTINNTYVEAKFFPDERIEIKLLESLPDGARVIITRGEKGDPDVEVTFKRDGRTRTGADKAQGADRGEGPGAGTVFGLKLFSAGSGSSAQKGQRAADKQKEADAPEAAKASAEAGAAASS